MFSTKEPVPHAEVTWQYRDSKDVVQGPFSSAMMRQWYKHNMFTEDLPLRRQGETAFGSIAKFFPPPLEAFGSAPVGLGTAHPTDQPASSLVPAVGDSIPSGPATPPPANKPAARPVEGTGLERSTRNKETSQQVSFMSLYPDTSQAAPLPEARPERGGPVQPKKSQSGTVNRSSRGNMARPRYAHESNEQSSLPRDCFGWMDNKDESFYNRFHREDVAPSRPAERSGPADETESSHASSESSCSARVKSGPDERDSEDGPQSEAPDGVESGSDDQSDSEDESGNERLGLIASDSSSEGNSEDGHEEEEDSDYNSGVSDDQSESD